MVWIHSFSELPGYSPLLDQLVWNIGFPHVGCTSNISPLVHSSKSLGTGLPCFSHQSHQDWKLHTAQIVLFSTNPFDIVFNSKSDVNLFPNLLLHHSLPFSSLLLGRHLQSTWPYHCHQICITPPVYSIDQIFNTFVHALHNLPPPNQHRED